MENFASCDWLYHILHLIFIYNMKFKCTYLLDMLLGVSKFLDCNFSVTGQPRYVEHKVSYVGKAVSGAAVLLKGLDLIP